jgi:hypothetical protein
MIGFWTRSGTPEPGRKRLRQVRGDEVAGRLQVEVGYRPRARPRHCPCPAAPSGRGRVTDFGIKQALLRHTCVTNRSTPGGPAGPLQPRGSGPGRVTDFGIKQALLRHTCVTNRCGPGGPSRSHAAGRAARIGARAGHRFWYKTGAIRHKCVKNRFGPGGPMRAAGPMRAGQAAATPPPARFPRTQHPADRRERFGHRSSGRPRPGQVVRLRGRQFVEGGDEAGRLHPGAIVG